MEKLVSTILDKDVVYMVDICCNSFKSYLRIDGKILKMASNFS